jgi:hypothetical protein
MHSQGKDSTRCVSRMQRKTPLSKISGLVMGVKQKKGLAGTHFFN